MKRIPLTEMSVPDLVLLLAKITVAQDEALLGGQHAKFNRLFTRMMEVSNELKNRDDDQRRQLVRLFSFPNMQVRLQAAKLTLAVAPAEARAQLQAIADSQWFPQAGDAGMSLVFLERGISRPD
ncbi:MAG: DUF2019 domain-containing protein [Tardiphaga sp.]|nr:DUF2019 domain-containing protein [Tardiphaga sp.]